MYKGKYYLDIDRIERMMCEMNYTQFEFLVLKLLLMLVKIKLDSLD